MAIETGFLVSEKAREEGGGRREEGGGRREEGGGGGNVTKRGFLSVGVI